MKNTVVILLSDKRSGTTWFEKELCSHPDVQHIRFTPHTFHESHYWVKAACMLQTANEGFSGGIRPRSYGSPIGARRSLVSTIQGNVPGFVVPPVDEQLIFEGWEALCREFARPVFFEKSPQHPHHWAALELMLQWTRNTEYRVRFIGLVRNPMAVMHSALQLFFTDPEKRQHGWMRAHQNILSLAQQVGEDQFLQVRYEDLVADPVQGFSSICRFIGIKYEDHVGGRVSDASLFKWRDDLDFDFQLDERVAAFAISLGYNKADLFNPPKSKPGPLKRFGRSASLRFRRTQSRLRDRVKRFGN